MRRAAKFVLGLAIAIVIGCHSALKAHACELTHNVLRNHITPWLQDCGHPLCGQARSPDGMQLPVKALCTLTTVDRLVGETISGLNSGSIVLIGETHDNGEQHALRAKWLAEVDMMLGNSKAKPPALVFEHIRADQQPALDQFAEFSASARRLGHSGDLFRFLDWGKSGWPDQKLFEPLFAAAIQFKLPILPGDPPREKVRAVAKGGTEALTADERKRLHLDQPLAPPLQDALLTELEASHCGLMPKTAFGNMAVAQRYRDAHLAEALVKAADAHGSAVLFAGNGHVRNDRGVPYYLRQMAPNRKVVTVMLLEVENGKTDPEAYVPRDPEGKPAADYIIFTPRAERKDPCADMRERFGKKK